MLIDKSEHYSHVDVYLMNEYSHIVMAWDEYCDENILLHWSANHSRREKYLSAFGTLFVLTVEK